MEKIQLTMTVEQAEAVRQALDAFARLTMGQLEEVGLLLRQGAVPVRPDAVEDPRTLPCMEVVDGVDELMLQAKRMLGFTATSFLGINHPHVLPAGRRSWEVKTMLDRALLACRSPGDMKAGVNLGQCSIRYTTDPLPEVCLVDGQ